MRARGHLTGGAAVAVVVASGASGLGWLSGPGTAAWWGVCATTLFFSLFPDVDTDSLPRRWFYRGVLIILAALAWQGAWELATGVAAVSLLPLVDHHRGWTHGRWMPLVAPAVLGTGLALWQGRDAPEMTIATTLTPVRLAFALAAAAGWYTHLLLDGLFRIFPPDPD